MVGPLYHHVQIQHHESCWAHLDKENLVLKSSAFPQSSLFCDFSIAGSVSSLLKPNQVWTRTGRPHSLMLHLTTLI